MTQSPSPSFADAFARHRQGDAAGAAELYRAILSAQPDHADALHYLGVAEMQQGDAAAAVGHIEASLAHAPGQAKALNNLGTALMALGRAQDARSAFERALTRDPSLQDARFNAATAAMALRDNRAALEGYRHVLAADPGHRGALLNLAAVLLRDGQAGEAAAVLESAASRYPQDAEVHATLADALVRARRPADAVTVCDKAITMAPGFAPVRVNRANALFALGRVAEAVAALDAATDLDPDLAEARSKRLFFLNYLDHRPAADVAAAHRAAGQRLEAAHMAHRTPPANTPDPAKRLKIGYVSPDFRSHSVAYFIAPVLEHHDGAAFEVFCYADLETSDDMTDRIRAAVPHFKDVTALDDDGLIQLIRADGIDVLIDLAGHTGSNRMEVFAAKAAPVQATWIGYPNTTGLSAIDIRLVDAQTDPPGPADEMASERLVRLDGGFLAYSPPSEAPDPAPPPCLRGRGTVTFGSFNTLAKLSPTTMALWAKVLAAVPGARLTLKDFRLRDLDVRTSVAAAFAAHGVAEDRLDLVGFLKDRADHLAAYGNIDIGLDPTPYNGTTTTCEALWMGVPVVTLAGGRHAARVGVSLLTRVGLGGLVAMDADGYVEICRRLAGDKEALAALRAGLRARMAASPLCDAAGRTRAAEAAFRDAWTRWCGGPR